MRVESSKVTVDTTVAEALEKYVALYGSSAGSGSNSSNLKVFDITLCPAKQVVLPRSRVERSETLHSLGLYPSAVLAVVGEQAEEDDLLSKVGRGWDGRSEASEKVEREGKTVQGGYEGWKGRPEDRPAPSAVLSAVKTRQDKAALSSSSSSSSAAAAASSTANATSEVALQQRIDKTKQTLAAAKGGSSKKRMSKKVLNMLVKSKAKGDRKIHSGDRFYVTYNTDGGTDRYKFFSTTATLGKIVDDLFGKQTEKKGISVNGHEQSGLKRIADLQREGIVDDFGEISVCNNCESNKNNG